MLIEFENSLLRAMRFLLYLESMSTRCEFIALLWCTESLESYPVKIYFSSSLWSNSVQSLCPNLKHLLSQDSCQLRIASHISIRRSDGNLFFVSRRDSMAWRETKRRTIEREELARIITK